MRVRVTDDIVVNNIEIQRGVYKLRNILDGEKFLIKVGRLSVIVPTSKIEFTEDMYGYA